MGITKLREVLSLFCHWSNFFFPWMTGNSRAALLYAAWAGAGTYRCSIVAPASGWALRMALLLNTDQHPWQTSLSICGFAQRTKLSHFVLAFNHRVRFSSPPWAQLYKLALSGRCLKQTRGFQWICTAVASGWEHRKPWCWQDKRRNSCHQMCSEFYCLSDTNSCTSIYWKGSNLWYAACLPLPLIQIWNLSAHHAVRPEVMTKKREDPLAS